LTLTITLNDSGPTSFELTIPNGVLPIEFIRSLIAQRVVGAPDGVTFYPTSAIFSMVVST